MLINGDESLILIQANGQVRRFDAVNCWRSTESCRTSCAAGNSSYRSTICTSAAVSTSLIMNERCAGQILIVCRVFQHQSRARNGNFVAAIAHDSEGICSARCLTTDGLVAQLIPSKNAIRKFGTITCSYLS